MELIVKVSNKLQLSSQINSIKKELELHKFRIARNIAESAVEYFKNDFDVQYGNKKEINNGVKIQIFGKTAPINDKHGSELADKIKRFYGEFRDEQILKERAFDESV